MFQLDIRVGDKEINKVVCPRDVTIIGRDKQADVQLENVGVSRKHCEIRQVGNKFILADLGSTNGTFLNQRRVIRTELQNNDTIQLGKVSLRFSHVQEQSFELDFNQTMAIPALHVDKVKPSFVASIQSSIFHTLECKWQKSIEETRRLYFTAADEAVQSGRKPCKTCKPDRQPAA